MFGKRMTKIGRVICFCFLLASLLAIFPMSAASAQEAESIALAPTYGKLEATAPGANFEFEVALKYTGSQPRDFDLLATGPSGWTMGIKPSYGEQLIRSIRLQPNQEFPDKVRVIATPPTYGIPDPKEYTVNFEASSGNIRGTVTLTAVITATYSLYLVPTTGLYNTKATAGRDNFYSISIQNMGSGTIENIKFSSSKPDGWTVEFKPDKMDSLGATNFQTVDVNIKPAPKAIAGDYQITLAADATQTIESIDVRVTVQTPSVWGWVGVGIILVVIAGVAGVFMRFSRR